MPELASLLGSFSLGFFLNAIYLILQEKQPGQLAGQFGTVGGTVWDSGVSQAETGMTRQEINQWSVLDTMSQVQQTATTPSGAEAQFCAAIETGTAPLSARTAKRAYPLITKARIPAIFEDKFHSKHLNCRIDGKGNRNYEYPVPGEEGGKTLYTETAAARIAQPTRGIYLATNDRVAA